MKEMSTHSALLVLPIALVLASCGGGSDMTTADTSTPAEAPAAETGAATSEASAADGQEMGHIHGLATDPATGRLLVATHHGLFAVDDGALQPVGEQPHDLMGFTVTADRFVASGHPAPGTDLPANLGLVESTDGGVTWAPVSLAGEADFHLLEAGGEWVYGGDVATGQLRVSDDRGATWQNGTLPGAVVDIAVDPADPARLAAATEDGLYVSADGAGTWTRVGAHTGLLAWAAADDLVIVGLDGTVRRSADGGTTADQLPPVDGRPVAVAADATTIHVALEDGRIVRLDGDAWQTVVR